MNGSPIARSIYYTTNNSNKVNGDSTKNRGDNLKHAPEAATSISSHYTPTKIRLSKICPCNFNINAVQSVIEPSVQLILFLTGGGCNNRPVFGLLANSL